MNKHCTFISSATKKSRKARLTTEISNMRAIAKIFRTLASQHLFKFCEQIEQRSKFSSALKL